ncbi:MAG TPA: DUF4038 domain-containing protein [Candidatus Acidoferrum sp.]|nr:DUF4038 domain-containing protein [Candidatus Acidoferrum sp.]
MKRAVRSLAPLAALLALAACTGTVTQSLSPDGSRADASPADASYPAGSSPDGSSLDGSSPDGSSPDGQGDEIVVTISPQTATVDATGTQQFTATVTGTSDMAVVWTVQESAGGTISNDGLFQAATSGGTFHVRATAQADSSRWAEATVTVRPLPGAPTIESFAASPVVIEAGSSSTLTWSVEGATTLTIDPDVGDVTGLTSKEVSPTETTTYTLTAANASGSSTATTTVVVGTTFGGFPLFPSVNKRYLQDGNGVPFPILGRAAWAVTSLNVADYTTFLEDTVAKGFNTIEIRGIPHLAEENNAPHAGNGALPFTARLDGSPWDGSLSYGGSADTEAPNLTTPNPAYWSFMDAFFAACEARGVLVLFFPAYVGYNADEGVMIEMVANGPAKVQAYGAFVATRYRQQKNLIWMIGGDKGTGGNSFTPAETAVEQALITGLKSVSGQQSTQFAAEWSTPTTGRDQVDFGDDVTLAGVYNNNSNGGQASKGREAYAANPTMPAFLLEDPYDQEGPDGTNRNPVATQPVRRFQWWGWLSTIGGHVQGNGFVWRFNPGWEDHLNTQGAQDMARLNAFMRSISWWELVPSGLAGMRNLVTSGGNSPGGTDYVAAAANPAGTLLVAYIPPDHSGSITVDMTALSASGLARWFDPSTGAYTEVGNVANVGTHTFTPPGNNGSGSSDWVLLIEVP